MKRCSRSVCRSITSAAFRVTKYSSPSAISAAADYSRTATGSICNSARAGLRAGRATGARTGCGSSFAPAPLIANDPEPSNQGMITVGQDITLTAADGFKLGGYRADPTGSPKGAIVVIQEIFGVNHHIRSVCDRVAAAGYVAIAPSIFDRIQPNFQCGYSPDEIANARTFIANPDWPAMLRDTQAAIDAVKGIGPVGIIGFCLGGSIAYAAATKLSGLAAAVGYYGGAVVRFADDKPKVPTQLHFGEKDAGIPLTDVETIKAKRPEVEVHIYPGAQHGFHCDERASYDKASADIAWPRSLAFFAKHLKK